jgi:hypothetical protein
MMVSVVKSPSFKRNQGWCLGSVSVQREASGEVGVRTRGGEVASEGAQADGAMASLERKHPRASEGMSRQGGRLA